MKKIFFVISFFISVFAHGQAHVTPVPQASTSMPFGYLDIRSFGAIGDSSTDNTTAFRACFAEAYRLHTGVFFPSGNWIFSDSVIVGPGVTIKGMGGDIITNDETGIGTGVATRSAATNILFRGNNKNAFVVDAVDTGSAALFNPGSDFYDFALWYQGTTPTSNAGLLVVDGGDFKMLNVSIEGFWNDLNVEASSYPSIVGCTFIDYGHAGMTINNSVSPDNGGTMITNTAFLVGRYTQPYAGFEWRGSGGFRMTNCEFNWATLNATKVQRYCVVLQNASTTSYTQEIYINNCSFSTFDSMAIKADSLIGNMKGIILTNIVTYGPINDSTRQAPIQFGSRDTSILIDNITVSNIQCLTVTPPKTGFFVPVCKFVRCGELHVNNIGVSGSFTGGPAVYIGCGAVYQGYEVPLGTLTANSVNTNGTPVATTITGNKDIFIKAGNTTGVTGSIVLQTPNNSVLLGFDTLKRSFFNTGSMGSFAFGYAQTQFEKDTATRAFSFMNNTNTGGWAGLGVQNNGEYGFIAAVGSTATAYKGMTASSVGIYSVNDINMQVEGTWNVFNTNSHEIKYDGSGQFIINPEGTSGTAFLDVNSFAGTNTFRLRGQSTAPSSPVDGSIYNLSSTHHLFVSLNGSPFQLDQQTQTFQQTLTAGSTLTGANTITTSAGNLQITLGTSNFILNGPGLIEQQNTAATFTYASEIGTSVTSHYGWGYLTPGNGGSFTHGIVEYDSLMNVTFPANVSFTGAGSFIMPIGNTLKVTEGAGGRCGQVALTSGTKAISISGVTTSSRAFVTLVSQGGTTTTTAAYIGVCTSNTLTISAVTAAGTNTVNGSDTSILNYFIIN